MIRKIKQSLLDQRGMQTLEAIGLAVIGLIAVSLIFNATKPGLNATSNKVGNTINAVNNKM